MVKALVLCMVAAVCACDIPDVTFRKPTALPDATTGSDASALVPVNTRWTIVHRASGTAAGCPVTAFSTKILVNRWDSTSLTLDRATMEFPVDCAAAIATIELLRDVYVARMRIQDSGGNLLMVSDLQRVAPGQDDAISFEFSDDAGHVAFAWNLVDGAGEPVSCAQAGISSQGGIRLVSSSSTGPLFTDLFACDDHVGSTALLPPGTYTFTVQGVKGVVPVTTVSDPAERTLAEKSLVVLDDAILTVE